MSQINNWLSLVITPDLGMLERQSLYLTLPWISLHPKIKRLGSRRASFIKKMTSMLGYSERSLKASPKGFLYTQLSKKQRQSKDRQITLTIILDFHKFYTFESPSQRLSLPWVLLRWHFCRRGERPGSRAARNTTVVHAYVIAGEKKPAQKGPKKNLG